MRLTRLRGRLVLAAAGICAARALAAPAPATSWADPASAPRDAEVAAVLRRAETAVPGGAEARRLSERLGEFGAAYLERGDSGRAVELLAEAYALDEGNASALADLTLAYARQEDFDAAAFYLRLAEERGGQAPAGPYASLGEIFYGLHRLDEAVAAWGEADRLGGQDPALLRRLARSRDELAAARGQRAISSENFAIFAEPAISDSLVRRVSDVLESAHRAQAAFFGTPLAKRQIVVLYGGRRFFALASVPDWVSGVYDGKIRVALRAGEDPEALDAVLAHELAHALMRQVSGEHAPGWLHEGLAQWLEGRRIPRADVRDELRRHAARSIEELEARFPGALDRAQARALYAQSLSLVEYLASARGEGALSCLVARLRDGAPFAEALRAETGWTPRELFAGWREWLSG